MSMLASLLSSTTIYSSTYTYRWSWVCCLSHAIPEFLWFFVQALFIWRCCSKCMSFLWSRGQGPVSIVILSSLNLMCITTQHNHYLWIHNGNHTYMGAQIQGSLYWNPSSVIQSPTLQCIVHPVCGGTSWLSRQRKATFKALHVGCVHEACMHMSSSFQKTMSAWQNKIWLRENIAFSLKICHSK